MSTDFTLRPDALPTSIVTAVRAAALHHKVPPALIEAQVIIESGGHPFAHNPEPRYRHFWNYATRTPFRAVTDTEVLSKFPPRDFPAPPGVDADAEWWDQQASWGLMQVMGAVARELGFRQLFLTQLVEPDVNLDLGCKKMASLLKWAKGNHIQALAAYNGGMGGNAAPPYRNQAYADKVMRRVGHPLS